MVDKIQLLSVKDHFQRKIIFLEKVHNLKKEFNVAIEEIEIVKENITFKIPGKLN